MTAPSVPVIRSTIGQRTRKGRVLAGFGLSALLVFGAGASAAWAAESPVGLGTSGAYSVLAYSTVTNTNVTSLSDNVGVYPGTAITGFPPGTVGGTTHAGDAPALQAQSDALVAYNDALSRTFVSTGQVDLGGLTLTPGAYDTGGAINLTGTLTLDAQGDPNAVFIFWSRSTLITATASNVSLTNGAQACNVFWVVNSSATLDTGSTFVGTIIAHDNIAVNNSVTVQGRALALNAAVTLDGDTFTSAACASQTPTPSSPVPALPHTGSPNQQWLIWLITASVLIAIGVGLEILQPRLSKRLRK